MSLSLQLGLVYLISEVMLTVTRRSRTCTGTKQDGGLRPKRPTLNIQHPTSNIQRERICG